MYSGIIWLHIVETERVIGKEKTEGYLCHLNSLEKCKVKFQWADVITHVRPKYYDTVFILAAKNTKLMLKNAKELPKEQKTVSCKNQCRFNVVGINEKSIPPQKTENWVNRYFVKNYQHQPVH